MFLGLILTKSGLKPSSDWPKRSGVHSICKRRYSFPISKIKLGVGQCYYYQDAQEKTLSARRAQHDTEARGG